MTFGNFSLSRLALVGAALILTISTASAQGEGGEGKWNMRRAPLCVDGTCLPGGAIVRPRINSEIRNFRGRDDTNARPILRRGAQVDARHFEYREPRRSYRRDRSWRSYNRRYRNWNDDYGPNVYLNVTPRYYEPDYYEPYYHAPRYYTRRVVMSAGHVQWCYDRYRSYREYDNTFQPYNGPRRQCYSPYS